VLTVVGYAIKVSAKKAHCAALVLLRSVTVNQRRRLAIRMRV
jgi:hypothetical protein